MIAEQKINMLIFFCDNLIVQGHQNRETYIGCGGSSGGYRFCEDSVGMYNPFSLLNTFCSNKFKDYWFETGTPTLLVNVMKQTSFDITTLSDNVVVSVDDLIRSGIQGIHARISKR